ncbi:hypothetical protein OKW96_11715 [Sphingobacterium sp. KU25419]|nr:hypothetical protein OKW96_11715 [Sphingobacterium sp. KU25419]
MAAKLKCFVIEDEPLATKKIVEYINMSPYLLLVRMVEDIEYPYLLFNDLKSTDILFLDLIVCGGHIESLAEYIRDIRFLVITSALSKWEYPEFIKKRPHFALQNPFLLRCSIHV